MVALTLALSLLQAAAAQDDTKANEALETFKTAIKAQSENERASAVTALAGTPHAKTLARIAGYLTADAPTVRIAAAKGLAAFGDYRKKAIPPLVSALAVNAKEPMVVIAILDTLAKIGDASALAPVHKLFDEKDTRIATAAFNAAGGIGSTGSVDTLIEQLKKLERQSKEQGGGNIQGAGGQGGGQYNIPDDDTARRRAQDLLPIVNRALASITKEKHGSHQEWLGWWTRNKNLIKGDR